MKLKLAGGLLVLAVAALVIVPRRTVLHNTQSVEPQLSSTVAIPGVTASRPPAKESSPLPPRNDAAPASSALGPGQDQLWRQPASEPQFSAFADWTRRYFAASPAAQAALEAEGVALARARLTALAGLIQANPARALELAVPQAVRQALPASVGAHLEATVNARGDYEVLCVFPLPGQPEPAPMVRAARINGEPYRVFTFGHGLDYVTRKDAPLNGIAVPISAASTPPADPAGLQPARLMALNPNPARLLEAPEVQALGAGQAAEPLCAATGQPWTVEGTPTAVQFGGEVYPFLALDLAEDWTANQTAAAALDTPLPPDNLPTAESSYTEGRKRFLVMRVDFPDFPGDAMSTNTALTLMRDQATFLAEISYYKHIIAPVGQGTDITPTMRMSQNVSAYDNAGLSKLYPEARDVAHTNYGYDLSKYDFCFVATGSRPAYTYAGLGYVGGVGYHLANAYFDVRTSAHEFGHNLGLGHANWWNTGGKSSIGAGTSEEYGDPFDTMGGSGGGVRHFSSHFKARLGWIPNSEAITATTNGIYRLYAQDIAQAPVGLRCIRLNRPSGDPYALEFRQLWTGNKALMNGVAFRWGGGSSILLDLTPGSAGNKDDHPLTIGRTFSEPALNFHITPLGKGHTWPESMDVAINFGLFPNNLPPTLMVSASATTAAAGQVVTFTARATDPNGDTLAYFWDFGDGDYSTDNSATTTHSFASAGEYYVECTVSDCKGYTVSDAVIVTVSNPGTFIISGRVLRSNSQPLRGIRVSVDASRYAFTKIDGTYTITRLAAGNYTVTAIDPVSDSLTFTHPFFSNPVTVGPDFTGADFIGSTNAASVYTPIVAKGAVWKYLDDGSNQGANWIAPAFNDTGWSNGAAILGYGEGDESTVIGYGPQSTNKYITYYFRKSFNVPDPAAYTNLQLEVLRDDGVIVYLNGTEVFRDNMPAGAPTYTTLASDTVEPDSYLQAKLAASVLVPGTNVLAAEVHQSTLTSSDLTFDLALSGLSVSNAAALSVVYVASPAYNAAFTSPATVPITAFARSGAAAVSLVEFWADGTKIGEAATEPYRVVWTNPTNGTHTLAVVAVIGTVRITSAPVAITVAPPQPFQPPPVSLTLVPTGCPWKYLAGPTDAPPDWKSLTFNDSAWTNGPAQLGYGEGDEATVIPYGGNANAKWITYYFRRAFPVNDPSAITNLALRLKRDDGAIVYLNGVEVLRDNMPGGPVTWATEATQAVPDDGQTFNGFTLDPAVLAVGTNILAVEIHQNDPTSSDVSFDLGLDALASTNRARGIWLVSPAEGTNVALPGSVTLTAQVVAGGLRGVTRVEFFSDGAKLGELATAPYNFVWANPPGGAHQLLAVATDTSSETITSAPVNITVAAPPLGTALVSFGEVWKYLDDGSNQGVNWTARTFDDRAWQIGAAKLGYGGDGETTTLSYGTNSAARCITAYFRKSFTVPMSSGISGLLLRLIRDDGAVVYLNGREIFRDNLQAGMVSFNSLALRTLNAPEETTPLDVTLPTTGLLPGTNVLAVEIHQASLTSSDAGFDLALVALARTNTVHGLYLTSPANGARFNAPADVELAVYAVGDGESIDLVEYFDGAAKIGEAAANPYRLVWSNAPVGLHTLTAQATESAGSRLTSAPVAILVGDPPPAIRPTFATLLPALSQWKYWDNVEPVGANWQKPDFDDSAWPAGPARFGFGFDGEITPLTEGRVTWYFRRWFTATNPGVITELAFQLVRDDGAVVYLNGREVFRSNMPAGAVNVGTLASTTVNTPDETTYFETVLATIGSGLLAGSNLVAVELHQAGATSSDAGFDLQLLGWGTTESRVFFTTPADGATTAHTAILPLEVAAWAGEAASVTRVEFLADGATLGESPAPPYRLNWSAPPYGTHSLVARATTSSGAVLESAPISITVGRETVSTFLIPNNSVWQFLDDGSDQGTNWAQPGYDDSAWHSGPARLGYGGDGEVTVVSFGPNANNKYITTYFRKTFIAPEGAVYTNLSFRLLRDDGAVVWLNGRELYRSNMAAPPAPIVYNTTAPAAVSGTDEQTFFPTSLAVTNLPAGTNLLAVEIHQSAVDSSDLSFNLELVGSGYVDDSVPVRVVAALVDGNLELSWPATAVGYRIYTAPALDTPAAGWTPLAVAPVVVNGRCVATITDLSPPARFFILGKP